MTEPGETDDYSVLEHVLTIERHLGAQLFDYVIYNTAPIAPPLSAAYRGAAAFQSSPARSSWCARLNIQPIGYALVSEHPAGDPPSSRTSGVGDHRRPRANSVHGVHAAGQEGSEICERFYELRERPFALSPDPDYLYPSRVHREALDYLRYGLESHAGFIVITGEIGSGKTTLLQTLLRGLDSQTTVGRIVNTILEPRELLETIVIDFGRSAGRSKPLLLRDLARYLVDQRSGTARPAGDRRGAERASPFKELRMLSTWSRRSRSYFRLCWSASRPSRNSSRRTRRPAADHGELPPVARYTRETAASSITASAGCPRRSPGVSREVTDLIHARSRGVPRIINVICDAALVFGYAEERRQVDLALMHEVMVELEATGVLPSTTATVPERQAAPHHQPVATASPVATVGAPVGSGAVVPMTPLPVAQARPAASARMAAPVIDEPLSSAIPVTRPTAEASPAVRAARTEAIDGRVAALDHREQLIAQRERELAEQRRVLAEEYRLLRTQRPAAQPAPLTPSTTVRMAVPRPTVPTRFEPARPDSAWGRLKRFVTGNAATAVEEN
jgi:type II secretory pathway predicted ATPase ExeA